MRMFGMESEVLQIYGAMATNAVIRLKLPSLDAVTNVQHLKQNLVAPEDAED